MANYYSGTKGKLFVGDADQNIDTAQDEVAKVRSWSFSVSTSTLETVSLGDFDRTIISGISSASGSASIYYYADTTTGIKNSGVLSSKIISSIIPTTSQERPKVRFRLQSDNQHRIDFDAVITNFSMTNAVGEVMSANVEFDVDGIPLAQRF